MDTAHGNERKHKKRSSKVEGMMNANRMQQPFNGRGYIITVNSQLQQAFILRKHWASLFLLLSLCMHVRVFVCVSAYVFFSLSIEQKLIY